MKLTYNSPPTSHLTIEVVRKDDKLLFALGDYFLETLDADSFRGGSLTIFRNGTKITNTTDILPWRTCAEVCFFGLGPPWSSDLGFCAVIESTQFQEGDVLEFEYAEGTEKNLLRNHLIGWVSGQLFNTAIALLEENEADEVFCPDHALFDELNARCNAIARQLEELRVFPPPGTNLDYRYELSDYPLPLLATYLTQAS